jgi:glycosyltransferase involved in cell wall biosynthesis
MRFCMVTTFYPPYHFGGDATYVHALARALVRRGHTVEVVHCVDAYLLGAKGEPASSDIEEDGIRVHRLRSRFGALSPLLTQQTGHPVLKARSLRAILDRDFEVVHFHNISLIGGPAVLHLSRAMVTLYSLHEHWLLCPTHIFWKLRSRACERPTCFTCSLRSGIPPQLWRYTPMVSNAVAAVDTLLAPSEYTAQRHRDAGFGPVDVLPLFSALEGAQAPASGQADQPPTFLFVGRITASKGIEELVQEFAALESYDLLVLGEGDARSGLERRFSGRGNIRFLGAVPQHELVELYRKVRALILPSLAPETFGLTVVEAFAHGTPAVVRDAGGARELVDATGAGFVYRSSDELRAAVHRLAGDIELRNRLGGLARDGYVRFYTEDRHLERYLGHIAAIIERKTDSAPSSCGRS